MHALTTLLLCLGACAVEIPDFLKSTHEVLEYQKSRTKLEAPVLDLVDDGHDGHNFMEEVQRGGPIVLFFHQPWCGWCRRNIPRFESVAARFSAVQPSLRFGAVDMKAFPSLHTKLNITVYTYPSIYVIKPSGGYLNKKKFYGYREPDSIEVWVGAATGVAAAEVSLPTLLKYVTLHWAIGMLAFLLECAGIEPTDHTPSLGGYLRDGGTLADAGVALGVLLFVFFVLIFLVKCLRNRCCGNEKRD